MDASAVGETAVVAVWCPADPLLGAAVAVNLAGAPGGPGVLVDLDDDWADAASVVLDDLPPSPGPPDDLLATASAGTAGIRVVGGGATSADPGLPAALRAAGGGVISLPARLAAAPVAAEADVLVLVVVRSFPSVRRARLALDALPAGHGEVVVVMAEGPPSDLRPSDVESVLNAPVRAELPSGGRDLAASLERGAVPAAKPSGDWATSVVALAAELWPGALPPEVPGRRLTRLLAWRPA